MNQTVWKGKMCAYCIAMYCKTTSQPHYRNMMHWIQQNFTANGHWYHKRWYHITRISVVIKTSETHLERRDSRKDEVSKSLGNCHASSTASINEAFDWLFTDGCSSTNLSHKHTMTSLLTSKKSSNFNLYLLICWRQLGNSATDAAFLLMISVHHEMSLWRTICHRIYKKNYPGNSFSTIFHANAPNKCCHSTEGQKRI